MILTHIDNFNIAGDDNFVEMILDNIKRELTISKVERNKFRFTGFDIASVEDGIEILIDDYVQSLKDIKEIRKAEQDEELSRLEMKEFRKNDR